MAARRQVAESRISQNFTGATANIFRFRLPVDSIQMDVRVVVGVGPSGGTALFDVHLDGTSIWNADQSQRITIPDAGTEHERVGVVITGNEGDEVTVDFDGFTGTADEIGGPVEIMIKVTETGASFTDQELGKPALVTTQFDKTNTTLADVTGLSRALLAGEKYTFRAHLMIDADTTGGQKVAMGASGGLTATEIRFRVTSSDDGSPGSLRITARKTALADAVSQAGQAAYETIIEGYIEVNAAGNLTVQFAQSSSSGTSTILVGSSLQIWRA